MLMAVMKEGILHCTATLTGSLKRVTLFYFVFSQTVTLIGSKSILQGHSLIPRYTLQPKYIFNIQYIHSPPLGGLELILPVMVIIGYKEGQWWQVLTVFLEWVVYDWDALTIMTHAYSLH